jgi:putative addiction module CopG family antidote
MERLFGSGLTNFELPWYADKWRYQTMVAYQFPPDLEDEIKQRMNTGRYESEDEVLREALRALKCRDDELAAIQEGIDDMEAGRVAPLREFDREFRERKNIPQDA